MKNQRDHTRRRVALAFTLAGLLSFLIQPGSAAMLASQRVTIQAGNAGDLDPSFGTGGKVTTDFGGGGNFG